MCRNCLSTPGNREPRLSQQTMLQIHLPDHDGGGSGAVSQGQAHPCGVSSSCLAGCCTGLRAKEASLESFSRHQALQICFCNTLKAGMMWESLMFAGRNSESLALPVVLYKRES